MSGRNNHSNRNRNQANNRRNGNNNTNMNNENNRNQVANLPTRTLTSVPLRRTITGFNYSPGLSQEPNNQNIHASTNLLPSRSLSLLPSRTMSYGIPAPGSIPITHTAASQGEVNNNNSLISLALPMRTMSAYPVNSGQRRPADIPAFLEAQGVPLNTPLRPGDSGVGPMAHMSIFVSGANPEQMEQVYRRERASMLYQMLSDRGYFDTPRNLRRPLREVLGLNEPQTPAVRPLFTVPSLSHTRYVPPTIPTREGGELRMRRANIGANAVDLEDFVDGETVEVLYTTEQARRINNGENVRITPSMIMRPTSVEQLIQSGSRINPTTRQPIALRETRVLRLTNSSEGGKRKNRKSTRKNRKH